MAYSNRPSAALRKVPLLPPKYNKTSKRVNHRLKTNLNPSAFHIETVAGGFLRSNSPNRRLAANGTGINCLQRPLLEYEEEELEELNIVFEKHSVSTKRYAYVWYGASTHYVCSAIAAVKILSRLREENPQIEENSQVDYVLTYVKEDLSSNESEILLSEWLELGGKLRDFPSLRNELPRGYYQASYQKFWSFHLVEYDRIIALDADGIPVSNLDHLFQLQLPNGTEMAAPQAYWYKGQGVSEKSVMITSVLLLFCPKKALFARVQKHFGSETKDDGGDPRPNYDMDIINAEFSERDDIFILPKMYGTLDSEYNVMEKLGFIYNECRSFSQVQYMHFTAKGKPWSHPVPRARKIYRGEYGPGPRQFLMEWFRHGHEACPRLIADIMNSTN